MEIHHYTSERKIKMKKLSWEIMQMMDVLLETKEFQKLTEKMLNRFESKPRVWDKFELFGTKIRNLNPSSFCIGQESHKSSFIMSPQMLKLRFCSLSTQIVWIGRSRPDVASFIKHISST